MSFEVRFSPEADDDLARLFDFLLDRAQTVEDLDDAQLAIHAIRSAVFHQLAATPYSFRKTGKSPTRRELIIPFGRTGYVALYEISGPSNIVVLAVRHQREEDYY
ncbi:type II toxin-antitoxin system RelE/ParE family toxin [Caldimonas brevitalea]|uniref:Plasmid stabilization protein n=1 Tax=Caldimonas brevitalea TaxID=413882 RepID=A0A0G3BV97_9BURK|nr:type II toxin-antitoxin system RelE/ParE family toxin [Caldimonas brevitalea]AKJ31958.1 plasmid stabilization protein [Caldimonas brevitalea]